MKSEIPESLNNNLKMEQDNIEIYVNYNPISDNLNLDLHYGSETVTVVTKIGLVDFKTYSDLLNNSDNSAEKIKKIADREFKKDNKKIAYWLFLRSLYISAYSNKTDLFATISKFIMDEYVDVKVTVGAEKKNFFKEFIKNIINSEYPIAGIRIYWLDPYRDDTLLKIIPNIIPWELLYFDITHEELKKNYKTSMDFYRQKQWLRDDTSTAENAFFKEMNETITDRQDYLQDRGIYLGQVAPVSRIYFKTPHKIIQSLSTQHIELNSIHLFNGYCCDDGYESDSEMSKNAIQNAEEEINEIQKISKSLFNKNTSSHWGARVRRRNQEMAPSIFENLHVHSVIQFVAHNNINANVGEPSMKFTKARRKIEPCDFEPKKDITEGKLNNPQIFFMNACFTTGRWASYQNCFCKKIGEAWNSILIGWPWEIKANVAKDVAISFYKNLHDYNKIGVEHALFFAINEISIKNQDVAPLTCTLFFAINTIVEKANFGSA